MSVRVLPTEMSATITKQSCFAIFRPGNYAKPTKEFVLQPAASICNALPFSVNPACALSNWAPEMQTFKRINTVIITRFLGLKMKQVSVHFLEQQARCGNDLLRVFNWPSCSAVKSESSVQFHIVHIQASRENSMDSCSRSTTKQTNNVHRNSSQEQKKKNRANIL